jgi:hypothetical protein
MSHLKHSDYIAHVLTGAPLPCSCEDCLNLVRRWEGERTFPDQQSTELSPGFCARQEAAIAERLECRPSPMRRWAAAAGAVAVVAGLALMYISRPSREIRWKDVEAQYTVLETSLDRPALGDLEACSLVLTEPSETTEEETL